MKAVILAGGFGTRISEETTIRPKPMVEIGERPILWHIMSIYFAHGIDEFVICCTLTDLVHSVDVHVHTLAVFGVNLYHSVH